MSRRAQLAGGMAFLALASAGPVSAAEPADLPALERAWHGCVREAYNGQQDRGSQAGRERNALGRMHKGRADRYVAALMAGAPT